MVPYKQEVEELNKPPVHAFLSAFFLSFLLHSVESCWKREGKRRKEREREIGGRRGKGKGREKDSLKMGIPLMLWQSSLRVKTDMKNLVLKDFTLPVLQLRVFGSVLFMYLSGVFNLLSIYHLWNNQVLTWDILTQLFHHFPGEVLCSAAKASEGWAQKVAHPRLQLPPYCPFKAVPEKRVFCFHVCLMICNPYSTQPEQSIKTQLLLSSAARKRN